MSLPLQLEVGVSSTHGFVGVRVLFEQRFAELSAALDGYGDHDVGDRGQRTVLTGGDRQDSRAEVGGAPGEVHVEPTRIAGMLATSRYRLWPDTNHRRMRSANASVSSTSLSWSTSLS